MTDGGAPSLLSRMHSALARTEDGILAVILCSMLLIAVIQIVLRNFFGFGIIWGETLVRVLVLWTALIGAMAATRQGKHINIDIITRYLPHNARHLASALVNLLTAAVCAVVMYYSAVFVALEYQDRTLAFGNVPNWLCEVIIPLAFFIMGLRYVTAFFGDLFRFARRAA